MTPVREVLVGAALTVLAFLAGAGAAAVLAAPPSLFEPAAIATVADARR